MDDSANMGPGLAVQLACTLEVVARKPGNVHRYRDFADSTLLDFLLSAAAIAPWMEGVAARGVGRSIFEAVQASRSVTLTNTNLGIVLLLAPLAALPTAECLTAKLDGLLDALTVDDADWVYQAIRLANPGGLGDAAAQDVHSKPTIGLRAAMSLAAERDSVARQYANAYNEVHSIGLPALQSCLRAGRGLEEAIIRCHLTLMAALPDSLIGRKRGSTEALESAKHAEKVLSLGWPHTAKGQVAFRHLDEWLRAEGNTRNPGATADLVAACLFVALRNGTIKLPLDTPFLSAPMIG